MKYFSFREIILGRDMWTWGRPASTKRLIASISQNILVGILNSTRAYNSIRPISLLVISLVVGQLRTWTASGMA